MSEDEHTEGPETEPAPERPLRPIPAPPPAQPAGAGATIGGICLIVFGLCILLLGGGCTIILIVLMADSGGGSMDGLPALLLAMAVTAGGVFAIIFGVRLCGERTGRG